MAKTVKINKVDVPVEDVIEIKMVCVNGELMTQVRYRLYEPTFHVEEITLPKDKGYQVELKVRKAMNKR